MYSIRKSRSIWKYGSRSRQGSIYSESGEREPKSPSAAALRRKYSISTAAKLEAVEKRLATHAEPVQLSELEEGQAGGDRPLSVGGPREGVGEGKGAVHADRVGVGVEVGVGVGAEVEES